MEARRSEGREQLGRRWLSVRLLMDRVRLTLGKDKARVALSFKLGEEVGREARVVRRWGSHGRDVRVLTFWLRSLGLALMLKIRGSFNITLGHCIGTEGCWDGENELASVDPFERLAHGSVGAERCGPDPS